MLSATATSSVGATLPRCAATHRIAGGQRLRQRADRQARLQLGEVGQFRHERAVDEHDAARIDIAEQLRRPSCARALAAASGGPASGLASRISARRSVYFHSSTRRCGRPCAVEAANAAVAQRRDRRRPAAAPCAAAKASASALSALVFIWRSSAFMALSAASSWILRIAARFELEREFLAAGLHDAALRQHVHDVRHDVVEQPLIVGDDDAWRARASAAG